MGGVDWLAWLVLAAVRTIRLRITVGIFLFWITTLLLISQQPETELAGLVSWTVSCILIYGIAWYFEYSRDLLVQGQDPRRYEQSRGAYRRRED